MIVTKSSGRTTSSPAPYPGPVVGHTREVMPTAEERESLLDFQGEDASLRDVEQKLRVLSAVPRPLVAESTRVRGVREKFHRPLRIVQVW